MLQSFAGILLAAQDRLSDDSTSRSSLISGYFARQCVAPEEKLWLQLDKPYYAAGDKIWFKGYLVNAVSHRPDTSLSNFIYVDLLDRAGKIVQSKKIRRDKYGFSNNFVLPATFPAGEYTIRAYTGWMLNFDPAFFFQKNIVIGNSIADHVNTEITYTDAGKGKKQAIVRFSNADKTPYSEINVRCELFNRGGKRLSGFQQKTSVTGAVFAELPEDSVRRGGYMKLTIDDGDLYYKGTFFFPEDTTAFAVQFFPEGGDLVPGQSQMVAFKAERSDGFPADVSGTVIAGQRDTVARFCSLHDGMGVFAFCPEAGKTYRSEIVGPNGRKISVPLPEVNVGGYAISVSRTPGKVRYQVGTAPGRRCDSMVVVAHLRGRCIGVQTVDPLHPCGSWDTDSIPEGILHLVLLDGRLRPRSERLVFVSHPAEHVHCTVTPDKTSYGRRQQVCLRIAVDDGAGLPAVGADCSVSITDRRTVKADTLADDIRSNLLLCSDIKGYVHNPGYYFRNETHETADRLDLVMRTNGWRRFDIAKIDDTVTFEPRQPVERDLFVSGHVTWILKRAARRAPVFLVSMDGESMISHTDTTDDNGNFRIGGLDFRDSVRFFLYSLTAKGKPMRSLDIDYYYPKPEFSRKAPFAEQGVSLSKNMEDYLESVKNDYYIQGGHKIYNLKEVVVRGFDKRKPTISVRGTLYDAERLSRMKSMPLPSFLASCFQANTRNGTTTTPNNYAYYHGLTTRDVEYVSVEQGGKLYVVLKPEAELKRRARDVGGEICKMAGYARSVQFYSPVYIALGSKENDKPDSRTTVYWNPNVKIDASGAMNILFYTDDNDAPEYDVTVEGVTSDGKICRYQECMK